MNNLDQAKTYYLLAGSEPFCSVFRRKVSEPMNDSREQSSAKPDGLPIPWASSLAGPGCTAVAARRNDMRPEELMKPDLLSEVVLLTFATLMVASLVLFVATMLARA